MATTLVIKSYLEMPDLSVETRRFVVERATVDKDGIYDQIHGKVGQTFPVLKCKKFTVFWKDDDDDFVTVSTDEEVRDLLSTAENGTCRIYIKVTADEPDLMDASGQDEVPAKDKVQGTHSKPDTHDGLSHGPPPPPPPPPFYGFHGLHAHGPFHGPWGWGRGGGHHKHRRHHAHGFGHPHHHHHHQMHHHWSTHEAGTYPYPPHCGFPWGMHGGKHGRTDSPRNLVPMPHRRWAKGFIQSWRKENLKNATTTTSDSDSTLDWKTSMDNAGVPQAYAEWLEGKLFRWHQKWSDDDVGEDRECHKMDKKAKKALKASVPIEFRHWTKRFLNSHFGRRDAPKFKRHHCKWNEDLQTNKKDAINAMVPKEYRVWTKNFIREWRIEKKLDEPNATLVTELPNGSSEDVEALDVGETLSIPVEYKQWLEKFLPRWHMWRGQLDRTPDTQMRGGMGQFKDTVPVEYRGWVKNYLCVHHGKHQKRPEPCQEMEIDPSQEKFHKMLQVFQTKWLESEHVTGDDSDALITASSSEEDVDAGEPEASFQRLSIDSENGSKKSKVRFNDSCNKKGTKKQKTDGLVQLQDSDDLDDDDADDMMSQRKERINPDFRHWAKQALFRWDGKTVDEQSTTQQDGEDEMRLPPKVYGWMSKMMMKMQMKKMKQQVKAAKREMKAAKKQQKNKTN